MEMSRYSSDWYHKNGGRGRHRGRILRELPRHEDYLHSSPQRQYHRNEASIPDTDYRLGSYQQGQNFEDNFSGQSLKTSNQTENIQILTEMFIDVAVNQTGDDSTDMIKDKDERQLWKTATDGFDRTGRSNISNVSAVSNSNEGIWPKSIGDERVPGREFPHNWEHSMGNQYQSYSDTHVIGRTRFRGNTNQVRQSRSHKELGEPSYTSFPTSVQVYQYNHGRQHDDQHHSCSQNMCRDYCRSRVHDNRPEDTHGNSRFGRRQPFREGGRSFSPSKRLQRGSPSLYHDKDKMLHQYDPGYVSSGHADKSCSSHMDMENRIEDDEYYSTIMPKHIPQESPKNEYGSYNAVINFLQSQRRGNYEGNRLDLVCLNLQFCIAIVHILAFLLSIIHVFIQNYSNHYIGK